MVINNNKNKKYIEINDENIIFYRWYGKRVLKREKIRAAYMDDNYVIRILYGKSIRRYNICNISSEHKIILEKLLSLMNKENIVFYRDISGGCTDNLFLLYLVLNPVINPNIINSLLGLLISISLLALFICRTVKLPYYNIFIYDLEKDEIRLESSTSKKIINLKIGIDNVSLSFNKQCGCYIFKYKWRKIQIVSSNIVYPKLYKSKMEEISCCSLINIKET